MAAVGPKEDETSILNILLRWRLIDEVQAAEVLASQGTRFVGQILIDKGYITQLNLDDALAEQQTLRKKFPPKRALQNALAIYESSQAKVLESVKDLHDTASRAVTDKFIPIKRTT